MTLIVFLYVSNLLAILYGLLVVTRASKSVFRQTALAVLNMLIVHLASSFFVFFFSPANNFSFIAIPVNLLYGALCYLLLKSLQQQRICLLDLIHLIPFFFGTFFYAFFTSNDIWRYTYFLDYVLIMYSVCAILYIFYGTWIMTKLLTADNLLMSRSRRIAVVSFFATLIILTIASTVVVLMTDEGNLYNFQSLSLLYQLIILLTIVYLTSFVKIKEIAVAIVTFNEKYDESQEKDTAIQQFKLPKDQEQVYMLEIEKFIGQKMYLDIDLNKDRFCELLAIPKHHVTPFLKMKYGKSFSNFVNHLRLNYAVKQLQREDFVYTIDDLSFICGFKSRASFYRNFVAEFGCSPHEYRNKYIDQKA